MAEARRPGTFTRLCCYEPVVMPPAAMGADDEGDSGEKVGLAVLARKRRPTFSSKAAALENYAAKPPFNRFRPDALAAYVEFGFVDDGEGGATLACIREDEASVFDGALSAPAWAMLPAVDAPVTVLGGSDASDPVGRVVDVIAERLPAGRATRFERLGHFGPFEDPAAVGSAMAAAFRAGRR
jgi:pimeloyl-ACP methyl ester carboxylesterase